MSKVGQIERATHNRIFALFQEQLYYEYSGNWEELAKNILPATQATIQSNRILKN